MRRGARTSVKPGIPAKETWPAQSPIPSVESGWCLALVLLASLLQAPPIASKVQMAFWIKVIVQNFHPLFLLPVQAEAECTYHEECQDPQLCHQGSCQNACRFQECGLNAICKAANHVAKCECLPGYDGRNPNRGCRKREEDLIACVCNCLHVFLYLFPAPLKEPSLVTGCARNDECPDYAACDNELCINPCAVRDPCAPLATCRVVGHEPVCTCPDGFIGSPTTECRPREYQYFFIVCSF